VHQEGKGVSHGAGSASSAPNPYSLNRVEEGMFLGGQTCVLGVGELVLRAKPAESAAQFLGAVPIVPTSMGYDHLLRLPGEHSI
jgi:hypothetical protein